MFLGNHFIKYLIWKSCFSSCFTVSILVITLLQSQYTVYSICTFFCCPQQPTGFIFVRLWLYVSQLDSLQINKDNSHKHSLIPWLQSGLSTLLLSSRLRLWHTTYPIMTISHVWIQCHMCFSSPQAKVATLDLLKKGRESTCVEQRSRQVRRLQRRGLVMAVWQVVETHPSTPYCDRKTNTKPLDSRWALR